MPVNDLSGDLPAGYVKPGNPKARPCALCRAVVDTTYGMRCHACWQATSKEIWKINFAIYDHPSDFPEHYVVRLWTIDHGSTEPTGRGSHQIFDTLEEAREWIPPFFQLIPAWEGDDEKLVETWV